MSTLWSASIAPATRSAYQTGIQCFTTFLTLSGMILRDSGLPHISEDVLIYFVTHCHSRLQLQYSTIKLYLAGIRFHYLQAGQVNPFLGTDRLQCVLRGIQRSQIPSVRNRLPITFDILKRLVMLLRKGVFSPNIDLTLECMCSLAFYGFLRCGEFTVRSVNIHSVTTFLQIKDVRFSQDHNMFTLSLESSKTDPFRQGVSIMYFRNTSLCPVSCMTNYLQLRHSTLLQRYRLQSDSPLFIDAYGQPFSRQSFLAYFSHLISLLSLNPSQYTGHSFRIGAATTAAAVGVEDHLIKTLGRWSSSCYTRYIHTDTRVLQNAQAKLCTYSVR